MRSLLVGEGEEEEGGGGGGGVLTLLHENLHRNQINGICVGITRTTHLQLRHSAGRETRGLLAGRRACASGPRSWPSGLHLQVRARHDGAHALQHLIHGRSESKGVMLA